MLRPKKENQDFASEQGAYQAVNSLIGVSFYLPDKKLSSSLESQKSKAFAEEVQSPNTKP